MRLAGPRVNNVFETPARRRLRRTEISASRVQGNLLPAVRSAKDRGDGEGPAIGPGVLPARRGHTGVGQVGGQVGDDRQRRGETSVTPGRVV